MTLVAWTGIAGIAPAAAADHGMTRTDDAHTRTTIHDFARYPYSCTVFYSTRCFNINPQSTCTGTRANIE